jgi:hypothetical protein
MLTKEQVEQIELATPYPSRVLALCADWRELQAQLAAMTADVRQMENFRAQDHEQWNKLEAQVAALTAERDAVRVIVLKLWDGIKFRPKWLTDEQMQAIYDAGEWRDRSNPC